MDRGVDGDFKYRGVARYRKKEEKKDREEKFFHSEVIIETSSNHVNNLFLTFYFQ